MNRRRVSTIALMPVVLSGLLFFLIQVTAVSGGSVGSHAIALPGEALLRVANEVEPNDTPAQANSIAINEAMSGMIPLANPADVDFFVLTIQVGREYEVTLDEQPTSGNYRLTLGLYDGSGNLVGQSETTGGSASLTWTATDTTYYFRVVAEEISSTDATYGLRAVRFSVPWDDCEINDAIDGAWSPETPPGGPCQLSVGVAKEDLNFVPYSGQPVPNPDYFTFLAKAGRTYRIATTVAGGADTEMWLYDPSDTQLAYDDDGGMGAGSRIERTLDEGWHKILVKDRLGLGSPPASQTYDIAVDDVSLAILYVKPSASGDASCSDWDNACTLQTALGSAVVGGEIWVAQGVHTPGADRGDAFQLKSGVAVYGGFAAIETTRSQRDWGAHPTVLSGDIDGNDLTDPQGVVTTTAHISGSNSYHVVNGSGVDATAVLDGFTITGGDADGDRVDVCGLACGGGMYNDGGSPTLANVIFSGNHASIGGGGMVDLFYGSPELTNVTFSGNSASIGGGIASGLSNPRLSNITFSGNSAGRGGGMFNEVSSPELTNVTFSGNSADYGGGMFNYESSTPPPPVANVTFSGNSATEGGGGMFNYDSSSPALTNVTFSGNSATEGGGGMYNIGTSATLTNCILWGNTDGGTDEQEAQIFDANSTITVSYSLVGGGVYTGTGNISADPLFVRNPDPGDGDWATPGDNDYGDLHLQLTSPAIDAGDNTAVPTGVTTDLDGNLRFVDIPSRPDTGVGPAPIVDMGAYEAQMNIYLPLVLRDH